MLFDKIKLEEDEKVLVTVRKHWFVITVELVGILLIAFIPFVILPILLNLPEFTALEAIQRQAIEIPILFALAAWMFMTVLSAFTIWTHYYLDLWVVTDRRIILVDQIHFFNRQVSMFRLERMQDIEFSIKGIIPTLLNYGTISAHTAGNNEDNFHSSHMPDPRGLQATIQEAMDNRLRTLHITPDQVAH